MSQISVLVCDNDRNLYARLLTNRNLIVHFCGNKEDADSILLHPAIAYDVFIINPILNGLSALKLIERLIKKGKTVLIVSDILQKDFASDILNHMVKFEKRSEFYKIQTKLESLTVESNL